MGNRLVARDLINIGVFTAVYFVIIFGSAFVGVIAPWAMFVGFFIGILLGGPVLVLLAVRSPAFGTMTLTGLLIALLMVLTGHFWGLLIIAPLLGLAFDAIMRAGRHRPIWVAVGYAVFSLWYLGPLLPIFFNSDAYFAETAESMGAGYAEAMKALFTPGIVVGFGVAVVVVGLAAGMFGTRMLSKHFVRAGLAG